MKSLNKTLRKLLIELFYENEKLSMTLLLVFMGYIIFSIGSLYLLFNNIEWPSYVVFASYTGGGAAALQFGNKFINSRYNSISGGYDERKIEEDVPTTKYFQQTPVNMFTERK